MEDIKKQVEDLLKDKVVNCKNSTTIFDTNDYILLSDAVDVVSKVLSQYVSDTTFADAFRAISDHYRWRKVSEELPEVREEHYWILTKSDDNRLDVISILNGYDKDVVKFLLKNYKDWKPID